LFKDIKQREKQGTSFNNNFMHAPAKAVAQLILGGGATGPLRTILLTAFVKREYSEKSGT
jgi:hypothetical protein